MLTTVATLEDLGEGFGFPFLVLNVRPEADAEDVGQGVLDRVGGEENVELTAETDPQRPGDVDSLADVTWVPALLAGILAFMAVVALAHAHHVGAAAPADRGLQGPRLQPPAGGRHRALAGSVDHADRHPRRSAPGRDRRAMGLDRGRRGARDPTRAVHALLAVLLVVPAALLLALGLSWLPARRAADTSR